MNPSVIGLGTILVIRWSLPVCVPTIFASAGKRFRRALQNTAPYGLPWFRRTFRTQLARKCRIAEVYDEMR